MKELSIEQKAKAYDKALAKAKEEYDKADGITKESLKKVFPQELKYADDEGVRKHLISLFEKFITLGVAHECESADIKVDDILAWLEKQGEQKPINIVTILDDYFTNTPKEQQDKDWEELKHLNNFGWELIKQKPAEWSEEDEARFESCIKVLQTSNGYDTINVKWLKSLKEKIQSQPKHEWSEEDKKMKDAIYSCVDSHYEGLAKTSLLIWLKSLRPQSTWKPSDKQIYSLDRALRFYGKGTAVYDSVKELLEQLKKLREE